MHLSGIVRHALRASLAFAALALTTAHAQTKAQVVAASQKGVNYILSYTKATSGDGCFTCHTTGPAIAVGLLAEKSPDLTVDQAELNRLVALVNYQQYDGAGTYNGAVSHGGNNSSLAYYYYTTTPAAVEPLTSIDLPTTLTPFSSARFLRAAAFLERTQTASGMSVSDFEEYPLVPNNPSETARAVRIWARAYSIDGAAHWQTPIAKAVTYLKALAPRTGAPYYVTDLAWTLMGLSAGGVAATDTKVVSTIAAIKARQNADGGWGTYMSSGSNYPSDSYATGLLLCALKSAGDTTSTAFANGVNWLLSHQNADGSWALAPGVSVPVSGSAWAVLALTEVAAATPPAITSALTATGTYNSPFSYTVTGSNTPTSYAATGLPSGLSISTTTGVISGTPTVTGTFSVTITATNSGGSGSATLVITINKAGASIAFGNLSQTYDGTAKSATATTSPTGLSVSLLYNGSSTAPINVGNYSLLGSISNANYSGSASGTFSIAPASVTITLGNLTQSYDGTAKSVSVTTAPSGVPVTVNYLGSPSPTNVGSYSVLVTSASNNYTGSATGVLQIVDTTAPVLSLPADLSLEATQSGGAIATFSASATDNVDGSVAVTLSPASGSLFPLGTTTVTASASDAAHNTATSSFTVTVADTTAPVLTTPASQTLEATGPAGAVATFDASATDLVSGSVTVSASPASGSTFPLGTTHVALSATDAAGNAATSGFDITVVDTTAPVISAPADLVIEATGAAGAVATFSASATDLVDGAVTVTSSVASGSVFPLGETVVTLTATDAHGNTATKTFSVTVHDTIAPSIAALQNLVLEATSAAGAVATFTPSALDLVDAAVSVTTSIASGSTFPLGETTVLITATDAAGNHSTATFTVTVVDTTAPVIATPASQTIEATSAAGAVATFAISANDIVDGAVAVSTDVASGATFPLGTTTVHATATDAHGNTATSSFTITVVDTTAPVIAAPADLTLEATSAAGAIATFAPTATDLVDGAVSVSASPAAGSTFPLGVTTVTLTATDAHGNSASASFTVTVVDTTAPALTLPASQTLEATSAAGAAATFAASASDLVDGAVAVTLDATSGATFPLGTTTVHATVTDAHGNTATGSFTITVVDTTAPAITAPANLTLEATSAAGTAATFAASASDLVDGAVSVTASHASGSTFAIGTTTVTLTATDAHGNTASASFTVTVADTTAPALTAPANLSLEAASAAGTAATFAATATDAVGATIAYSIAPGSVFPLGTTTVTVTAKDAAGNSSNGSFTVTVVDTTAPVLTLPVAPVVQATSAAGAAVTFAATATDAVGATIAYSIAPGSVFPLGQTKVTVTATDAAGNKTTGSFIVTVRDLVGPALALPGNLVVEATGDEGTRVTYSVSATDAVTGPASVILSKPSGYRFPLGTTTVTATARDAFGNVTTGSFTVTVRDTTAPKLKLPSNRTVSANSAAGARVYFHAEAWDLVDEHVKITYSVPSGSTFPLGTTTVTVTATDDFGNVATGTFTVTVVDKTKPVFTKLSVNPSLLTNSGAHQMVAVTVTALAKDTVDPTLNIRIVSITSDEPATGTGPGDIGPDYAITGALTATLRAEADPKANGRIYTIAVAATDDSGNTRTRTLHVLVPRKAGARFEDCDRNRRSDERRCDDEARDYDSRDQGDDGDDEHSGDDRD